MIVGWRCSRVYKHEPPTNHILVAYKNVDGCGHGPLDFHASPRVMYTLTSGMNVFFFTCRGIVQNYRMILFELNLSILISCETFFKYFARVYYNRFLKVSF